MNCELRIKKEFIKEVDNTANKLASDYGIELTTVNNGDITDYGFISDSSIIRNHAANKLVAALEKAYNVKPVNFVDTDDSSIVTISFEEGVIGQVSDVVNSGVANTFSVDNEFYELPFEEPLPDLSMEQGSSANDARNEALIKTYTKLTKLLKGRIISLEALKGADAAKRVELNTRIRSIKSSIERIKSNITYDNMLSVMRKMLSEVSNKIYKNPNITDLNESYNLLNDFTQIQELMEDRFLTDDQVAVLSKVRAKILELEKAISKKFVLEIQKIAYSYGLDYTLKDIEGAYKDISAATSNYLSEYDSNLVELKIAGLLFNHLKLNIKQDVLDKKEEANKLTSKIDVNKELQKIFDSNGRLITQINPEYYAEEQAMLTRIGNALRELREVDYNNRDYLEINNLEEERVKWYLDNHEYHLSPELAERYSIDEEAQRDALREEDGSLSADSLKELNRWIMQHNPHTAMEMISNYKKTGVLKYSTKQKAWYKYLSSTPDEKWNNPLYEGVKDSPLYNFLVSTIVEAQKEIPHKEVLERTSFDRLLKEFVIASTKDPITAKTVFNNIQKFAVDLVTSEVTSEDLEGKSRTALDESGREIQKIRHLDLRDLVVKNPKDVLDSILKFYEFSKIYKHKSDITPILNLLTTNLSRRKVIKTNILGVPKKGGEVTPGADFESEALKLLKFAITSKIYDKTRLDEDSVTLSTNAKKEFKEALDKWEIEAAEAKKMGLPVPPKPTIRAFSAVKTLDSIVDWTRTSTLSLKPFTSITNLLIGLNANFIHAARKTDFDDKSLFKALKLLNNNVIKYWTRDKVVTKDAEKILLFAEKHGATDSVQEADNLQNKLVKFLYTWQTSGEFVIHVSGLLAKLKHTKVKNLKGEEKSLYDAFEIKNGVLKWNTEEFGEAPEWTNPNHTNKDGKLISKIFKFDREYQQYRKSTQGNYMDAMRIKGSWYGRVLMLFRTWLPQAVESRFGAYRQGDEFTRDFMGRYRSFKSLYDALGNNRIERVLKFLGITALSLIPGTSLYSKRLSKEVDIENMRANIRELQLIVGFVLLGMMLKQMDDDDDDANLSFLINVAQRSYQDLGFFYSPTNAQNILRDVIPIMKTVNDSFDVIDAGTNLITDPKTDIYQRGIRKGHSKFIKELSELFPVTQSIQSTISSANQTFGEKSYKFNK